jgi:hypothetical protein
LFAVDETTSKAQAAENNIILQAAQEGYTAEEIDI